MFRKVQVPVQSVLLFLSFSLHNCLSASHFKFLFKVIILRFILLSLFSFFFLNFVSYCSVIDCMTALK
jgi:hypothetical protein